MKKAQEERYTELQKLHAESIKEMIEAAVPQAKGLLEVMYGWRIVCEKYKMTLECNASLQEVKTFVYWLKWNLG